MEIDKLNLKQLFFIRKLANGVPYNIIKEELCDNSNFKILKLKNEVKVKLKAKDDIDLIKKIINSKVIEINEYFIKNQSHIAFGIAYNLYIENKGDDNSVCANLKNTYEIILIIFKNLIITQDN